MYTLFFYIYASLDVMYEGPVSSSLGVIMERHVWTEETDYNFSNNQREKYNSHS